MKHNNHEPLFHIVKRNSLVWWKAWLVRILAVLAALIVCAGITNLLTGKDPLGVYATMVDGAFGTKRRIWSLFQNFILKAGVTAREMHSSMARFWKRPQIRRLVPKAPSSMVA